MTDGRWLVVMALPLEAQDAFAPLPHVVNFGSAGSRRFATGTVVACTAFHQRDMDVSGLGFAAGTTPYEAIPAVLEFPAPFPALPHAACGTGDSFETGGQGMEFDVVDMEAYAFAKVCHVEGTAFACAKYVSDGADHAAASDWQANLHRAADQFLALYRQLQ